MRIHNQFREAIHRQEETNALLEAIMSGRLPLPTAHPNIPLAPETETPQPRANNSLAETVAHFTTTDSENALGLFEGVPQPPPIAAHDLPSSQILPPGPI